MHLSRFLRVSQATALRMVHKEGSFMSGKGGRANQNHLPQGLTWTSLQRHYSLMPLFFVMACGGVLVVGYMARTALKSTDVTWTHREAPYDDYKDKQFKMLNPNGVDYKEKARIMAEVKPDYKN